VFSVFSEVKSCGEMSRGEVWVSS